MARRPTPATGGELGGRDPAAALGHGGGIVRRDGPPDRPRAGAPAARPRAGADAAGRCAAPRSGGRAGRLRRGDRRRRADPLPRLGLAGPRRRRPRRPRRRRPRHPRRGATASAAGAPTGASGPGVLLLHGLASTAWGWAPVARRLCGIAHVVAVDLRGHGLSDAPTDGYEPDALADDVIAVAEGAGLLEPRRRSVRPLRSSSPGSATGRSSRPGRRTRWGTAVAASSWSTAAGRTLRRSRGRPRTSGWPPSRSRPRCSPRWVPGWPTARRSTPRPGMRTRSAQPGPRWSRRRPAGSSLPSTRTRWPAPCGRCGRTTRPAVLPTVEARIAALVCARRGWHAVGRAGRDRADPACDGSFRRDGQVVPVARATTWCATSRTPWPTPCWPSRHLRGDGCRQARRGIRCGHDRPAAARPRPHHRRRDRDRDRRGAASGPRRPRRGRRDRGRRAHAGRAERTRRGGSARDPPRDGRGPRSPGSRRDAGARPPDVRRADRRVPRRPGAPPQRRDLRRRLLGDGGRQGDPVLQPVRAPPAAVLRDGGSRLHPQRARGGAVEDPPHRGDVRPPPAGAGAAHLAGGRLPDGSPASRRGWAWWWRRPTCAR